VPPQCRRERSDFLVQVERRVFERICLVGNGHEQGEPVVPEQSAPRRTHEPVGQVKALEAGSMPMPKRLSQPSDIVARGLDEPLSDTAAKARPLLVRDFANGSIPDQVVRETEDTCGLDADAALDELTRRQPSARFIPAAELGSVRERDRARRDRKKRKQRGSVRTGPAKARGDKPIRIDLRAAAPRERLEPKR